MKKQIPKKIRQLVWNKYIGEKFGAGICQCCKITEISQMNFHCGHITSEKNGGDMTLTNLLPICALCNLLQIFGNAFFTILHKHRNGNTTNDQVLE